MTGMSWPSLPEAYRQAISAPSAALARRRWRQYRSRNTFKTGNMEKYAPAASDVAGVMLHKQKNLTLDKLKRKFPLFYEFNA